MRSNVQRTNGHGKRLDSGVSKWSAGTPNVTWDYVQAPSERPVHTGCNRRQFDSDLAGRIAGADHQHALARKRRRSPVIVRVPDPACKGPGVIGPVRVPIMTIRHDQCSIMPLARAALLRGPIDPHIPATTRCGAGMGGDGLELNMRPQGKPVRECTKILGHLRVMDVIAPRGGHRHAGVLHALPRDVGPERSVTGGGPAVVQVSPVAADIRSTLNAIKGDAALHKRLAHCQPGGAGSHNTDGAFGGGSWHLQPHFNRRRAQPEFDVLKSSPTSIMAPVRIGLISRIFIRNSGVEPGRVRVTKTYTLFATDSAVGIAGEILSDDSHSAVMFPGQEPPLEDSFGVDEMDRILQNILRVRVRLEYTGLDGSDTPTYFTDVTHQLIASLDSPICTYRIAESNAN